MAMTIGMMKPGVSPMLLLIPCNTPTKSSKTKKHHQSIINNKINIDENETHLYRCDIDHAEIKAAHPSNFADTVTNCNQCDNKVFLIRR